MSIWMEIHCDKRAPVRDPRQYPIGPACYGEANRQVCGMFENTQSGVVRGWRYLRAIAQKQGWHWTGKEWHCPNCRVAPPTDDNAQE